MDQRTERRPSPKHQGWTGALPFLSLSILQFPGSRHILRFDLESAFYVAIWDMCLWPHGQTGRLQDPNAIRIFDHWGCRDTAVGTKLLLWTRSQGVLSYSSLNVYIKACAPILHTKFIGPVIHEAQWRDITPDTKEWEDLGGLLTSDIARAVFAELEDCLSKHHPLLTTPPLECTDPILDSVFL